MLVVLFKKDWSIMKIVINLIEDICTACGNKHWVHRESSERALCPECMDVLDLVWDSSSDSFKEREMECPDCGGMMSWCSFCETYTQNCCVDYGTCLCS